MRRLLGLDGLDGPLYRLTLAVLLFHASDAAIIFLMLYLTEAVGLPVDRAGMVMGMLGLGAIAGSYLAGSLCDRFPARFVLIVVMIATGILISLVGALSDPWLLALLLFLLGMARGGARPAYSVAMMGMVGDAGRMQAFSVYLTAVNLGAGISAALAAWMVVYGYGFVFLLSGAMAVGGGVLVILTSAPANTTVTGKAREIPRQGPFTDRAFMVFCGAILAWSFIAGQSRSTYPVYLTERFGIDASAYGLLWTINMTIAVLFSVPLSAFLRRFERGWAIMASTVLFSIFALLPYGEGPIFLAISMAVFTIGGIALWPLLVATVLKRGEDGGAAGRYMGVYNALFSSAHVVAPVIGSATYAVYGGDAVWHLVALSGAAAIVLSFAALRWSRNPLAV